MLLGLQELRIFNEDSKTKGLRNISGYAILSFALVKE
jgi:hypothetical protein